MSQTLQFTAAVFSSREDIETLARTITFLLQADRANAAIAIDVLVNGNESLARKCAEQFRQSTCCPIRIFHFSYADKAETWNEYVHSFHPGGDYTFFLDGYAAVEPQALLALVHAHRAQPEALAASGIQRYGPSARRVTAWQMARGGLSGNLYMLPYSTISRLRQARFRLPVGIYRTDSTLGAALFIDLDPERAGWNPNRIVTVPQASFTYPIPRFWRWKDLRTFARRRMRQARGLLENRAIRDHFLIRRRPVTELPTTAFELVAEWIARNPAEASRLFLRSPLAWFAYKSWSPVRVPAQPPVAPVIVHASSVDAMQPGNSQSRAARV